MSLQSMFGRSINKIVFLGICAGFLFLAGMYRQVFLVWQNTPEKNIAHIQQKLNAELSLAQIQIVSAGEIIQNNDKPVFGDFLFKVKHPYYIFQNGRIMFWSENTIVPLPRDIIGESPVSCIKTARGIFIYRKEIIRKENQVYEVVVFVPLTTRFPVVNQYLQYTVNRDIFTDVNFEISLSKADEQYLPVVLMDKEVFYINLGSNYSNAGAGHRFVLAVFLLVAVASLMVYITLQTRQITNEQSVWAGLTFLLASLVSMRSLMLLTGFPADFVYTEIFDPRYYGSTVINPSLGDLILNIMCLLVLGFFIFRNFLKPAFMKKLMLEGKKSKTIFGVLASFFSFFSLAVHHLTIKSLDFDSQWSMDLGNSLNFNYLTLASYEVFFLSVVVYFLFSHTCFRIIEKSASGSRRMFWFFVAAGASLFLALGALLRFDVVVIGIVNMAFIFMVHLFRLHRSLGKIQYLSFIYLFSFGFPGSLAGAYANYLFRQSRMEYNRSRIANQVLVERDFFTELQFAEVVESIKNDAYITRRIIDPYASKAIIEKKIRNEYLHDLDKYDIGIYVFNSRGEPFEQFNIKDNFHDYEGKLGAFATETQGLYFVNLASGQATARYVIFIDILERGQIAGYILLDLRQKRYVPNSVFPLLSNESSSVVQPEVVADYSYGVFVNNKIKYNSGDFGYRNHMVELAMFDTVLFEKSIVLGGYNHKAYKGDEDRFVIVSAKEPSLVQRIANFSFLFLIYIFSILIVLIALTIYQRFLNITLNYATKIQLYLNIAFFTPLIIVSLSTVSIIVQTFKASLDNQYLELADNLANRIAGPLNNYRLLSLETEELTDEVSRMAEVADLDINIFHTNGRLITSSLMQVYQNEILSENMEPGAYAAIMEDLATALVKEEKVGSLNYKNAYVSIRSNDTGAIIGILSLPFFGSQTELNRRIIDVMSNIINIFTLLFVFFLFISFFVSRGLTFPLRLITQKIKRTTLSAYNEPLSWNSDDEIGLMVTEYNRMLINLEESKKALAKSEKESAWREMARQVAHEIKNPLTPMKLSLQHMSRTLSENLENGDKNRKMQQINSLLEQIETLNDIATSFSDFARMPSPAIEHVDMRTLLLEIIDLYEKSEQGAITSSIQDGVFVVEGDKKWLGRAFSNLIINAFQAVDDPTKAKIEIRMTSPSPHIVRIEITDNGGGIPEQIREKVFSPNFSTKYSGSGLGLAITKKGIEHANGKIWFETSEGLGTTFFIEIPRV